MPNHLKQGYYLGIDGGGTKTEAVIADENGTLISRGIGGSANQHNVPLDIVFESINQAIMHASINAKKEGVIVNIRNFQTICIGIAGMDSPSDRQKIIHYWQNFPPNARLFNADKVMVCSDGFIGLKSGTDANNGVCLISSTGSNCCGFNTAGETATSGDWGYVLGDQGSGFAIGLKMIQQVMKEFDGRSIRTDLTPLVLKQLHLKKPTDLIPWAYNGPVPVKEIASLSMILNDVNVHHLSFLSDYIHDTVTALTDAYRAVINRLQMQETTFPVVLVGGLFNITFPFIHNLEIAIREISPEAHVIKSIHTPAEGALKIALADNNQKSVPAITVL